MLPASGLRVVDTPSLLIPKAKLLIQALNRENYQINNDLKIRKRAITPPI
jgi:hypothetical protein